MVVLVAFALAGTGTALWPLEGVTGAASQGARFGDVLRVNGWSQTVAQCGGVSPTSPGCTSAFSAEACMDLPCRPQVGGTLGYTGSITAIMRGRDCSQRYTPDMCLPGTPLSVWKTCNYVAGQGGGAGNVRFGGCSPIDGDRQVACPDGSDPDARCFELYPPLTLSGVPSAPPVSSRVPPSGPWQVSIIR